MSKPPQSDDKDLTILELFEHSYFMHGYLLGALMRSGCTGKQAWEETKPMRDNVKRLAERCGIPTPSYFEEPEGQPES